LCLKILKFALAGNLYKREVKNMNIQQKIFSATVTGAMVLSLVAPSAFASNHIKVKNSGAFSSSYTKSVNINHNSVHQGNFTVAGTFVNAVSNTGGNSTSFNTKGDSSIKTDDATTKVTTTVGGSKNVNTNTNSDNDNSNTNVNVGNNGAFSSSYVKVVNVNSNSVSQVNGTVSFTGVDAVSNTGGNSTSFNTKGDSSIDTGDASTTVTTTVGGSINTNN
jgi:hypothetical protein